MCFRFQSFNLPAIPFTHLPGIPFSFTELCKPLLAALWETTASCFGNPASLLQCKPRLTWGLQYVACGHQTGCLWQQLFVDLHGCYFRLRGGSAGIQNLYLYVTYSVMVIKVMRLSYYKRVVPEGRFWHHLFQAVFVWTTYPSRYVFQVVKSPHSRRDCCYWYHLMWECYKSWVQLETFEICEIQAPVAHEHRVLSSLDLHQFKNCFCTLRKSYIMRWHSHQIWSYKLTTFCVFGTHR